VEEHEALVPVEVGLPRNGVHQRAGLRSLVQLEQTDPLVVLRMQARHIREVATRVATLDSVIAVAADADPEAAALRESIQQQRLIGATLLVRWLRDRGWLRRGTRVRHGAEVCWLLMDPTAYRWLVTEEAGAGGSSTGTSSRRCQRAARWLGHQDPLIRSMPSCAAEAISRPSAANIRPKASPRPPCAVGDVWL